MVRSTKLLVVVALVFGTGLAVAVAVGDPPAAKGSAPERVAAPVIDSQPEPIYRSPNAIVMSPDGRTAYVVNQTANSVSVLDVPHRRVTATIAVGAFPSDAALSPDGGTLYVTCHWGATVDVIDVAARRVVRSMPVGLGPYGVAVSRDGGRLFVVDAVAGRLLTVTADAGKVVTSTPVGRDPRYVAVSPDGAQLLVGSGLTREVFLIDAATGKTTETRRLGRASILRNLAYSRDGRWAFVTHIISHDELVTLQMERGFIHANGISVLDLSEPGHFRTLLLDRLLVGAANPWGLALSPDGRQLYVSLAGVHEVAIVDVPAALRLVRETPPEGAARLARDVEIVERRGIARRVDAGGKSPRSVAVSRATGELLVASYFNDWIALLDPESGAVLGSIPLGPELPVTLERRGEMLFNDADLCFQKWFSCASCHQEDAGVDGLTWDLANDGLGNPKNAKSLHDAHDTPPAMWHGVRRDLDACVAAGQRFLGAIPKPENQEALVAYLRSSRRSPNPFSSRKPQARHRGERIFFRALCDTCHPAPLYTDLKMHDLATANATDLRSRFDTPTLRECYRSSPYLHDGRAETLLELFTKHNPSDFHGRTSDLAPSQLEDLVAYLEGL